MANEHTDKKMNIELENPANFTSPEELYQKLIRTIRKYHPSDDISMIEIRLDKETIASGLLHDVVEDTVMTLDDMTREFGSEVAFLVDGVTKLTQLSWDKDKVEIQAENLRKMFLAMARDIRVIIIKLADRLHNMRTGQFWKQEKQKEKARETLEIYAPIAV